MKQNEEDFTNQFVPEFVNEEPLVLGGLTDSEMKQIGIAGLVVGGVLGVLVSMATGVYELILALTVMVPLIAIVGMSKYLAKARKGKPPGYVEQTLNIKSLKYLNSKGNIVYYSAKWSTKRGN